MRTVCFPKFKVWKAFLMVIEHKSWNLMAVHIVCKLRVHSGFLSETEMWLQCCSQPGSNECLSCGSVLPFVSVKQCINLILMFDFTNSDTQQGSTSNMTAGHCIFFTRIYPYRLFFCSAFQVPVGSSKLC